MEVVTDGGAHPWSATRAKARRPAEKMPRPLMRGFETLD
jgi:hypothetical protein